MTQRNIPIIGLAAFAVVLLAPGIALSHVPYIESSDFTMRAPFLVEDVPNSKAIFSYLEGSDDYDVYTFELSEPTRIFASTTIPLCLEYGEYSVTFAITGPGLPTTDVDLPIRLRKGDGAVVVRAPVESAQTREWFYEPYGKRYYFTAPDFVLDDAPPGRYQMVVWHEEGVVGDYLAVIGEGERWGPAEIAQAQKVAAALDAREDLHVACNESAAVSALKSGQPIYPPRETAENR